jgi:hypothetical protein
VMGGGSIGSGHAGHYSGAARHWRSRYAPCRRQRANCSFLEAPSEKGGAPGF